ncbi:MAG: SDR family oxidoreductase [Sphingomicrobium sp.]
MGPEPRFGRAKLRVLIMGAGAGIGLACARAFARQGAELLLADIDAPALKRAVCEAGGSGQFCDVASEASVAVFTAEVQRTFSSLDVIINAAGQNYVRTLGTLRISRALLPMMKDGGRKDIVNIAHIGGAADNGHFPYAASIEAFACLADALAENVRGTNIILTTIMPGRTASGVENESPGNAIAQRSDTLSDRRLFCEISDCDALAAKIVAGLYEERTGRHPGSTTQRASTRSEVPRRGTSGC